LKSTETKFFRAAVEVRHGRQAVLEVVGIEELPAAADVEGRSELRASCAISQTGNRPVWLGECPGGQAEDTSSALHPASIASTAIARALSKSESGTKPTAKSRRSTEQKSTIARLWARRRRR